MGTNVSIADALFTRAQQRVLGLLFAHPEQGFYLNEIVRIAGLGKGAVQRELARLEAARLIASEMQGRQKYFRANARSPVYAELRGLVLKTSGAVDVLRTALAPAAAQIEVAFIYGSIAKGTDQADSDIDLMVVGEEISYAVLYPLLGDAEGQLGRKINPTLYTSREWEQRLAEGNAFVTRVSGQPKLFVIGDKDDFERARVADAPA